MVWPFADPKCDHDVKIIGAAYAEPVDITDLLDNPNVELEEEFLARAKFGKTTFVVACEICGDQWTHEAFGKPLPLQVPIDGLTRND